VAYKDRAAALGEHPIDARDALAHTVIIDGRAVGTWKVRRQTMPGRAAAAARSPVSIAVAARVKLARADWECIRQAADRYGRFTGRKAAVGNAP